MPLQLALPPLGFLGYFEVWQLVSGIGAGGNMMLESQHSLLGQYQAV